MVFFTKDMGTDIEEHTEKTQIPYRLIWMKATVVVKMTINEQL